MAIADDFSVAINGDVRYTGSGANYTVLELHRFLQDLADDAQSSGDDLVDIVSSTPSDRSTDQIIDLINGYNVDDTAIEHLYDGSITQSDGDTRYSGLEVVGTIEGGTELMLVQDGEVLPAYWGTGLNGVAAQQIIMRIMVKTRDGGATIDGGRLLVRAHELGDRFAEFRSTLGLANSTAAVFTTPDLNNTSTDTAIEAWSSIVNTEGFQELNIDGTGAAGQEFYSQWDIGTQTKNDTYERTKWITQRAHIADNGTDTGNDFVVDNGTILGQGQEFDARGQAEKLQEARFRLKIGGGTPTGTLVAELYLSDDVGAGLAEPTGAVLATSEPVLTSRLTSSYQEFIFRFNDNVTLTASESYFIVIRNAAGDGTNFVHVDGSTSGAHAGNRAEDTGTWAATAADDLWFTVKSSPVIHSIAGELFRGITHEVVWDTGVGTFQENEILFWGTDITYDTLVGGPFTEGEYVTFDNAGTIVNSGKIVRDNGTTQMMVILEDSSGGTLADGYTITGLESGATADINITIVDQDRAGGEALLLALDDNTGSGDFYIQLLNGSAPVDNLPIEGRTSGATAAVNVTVTSRTISPEFLGQSTGSSIIGAYGIGFDTNDVGASDTFFDLSNTQRTPPNNVTFSVTGLVVGEDRVLIGPRSAGVLQTGQFTTDTTLSAAAETVLSLATVAVPTDTPSSGEGADNTRLRVERDSGPYTRQPYQSYDAVTPGNFTLSLPDSGAGGIQLDVVATAGTITRGSGSFLTDGFERDCRFTGSGFANGGNNAAFTVASVTALVITVVNNAGMVDETGSGDERVLANGWDYSVDNATSGNNVFIAYIDVLADATSEGFTAVYNVDRDLFVRVRDGGGTPIKTFETPATFGSTSSSVAAIRTSDA